MLSESIGDDSQNCLNKSRHHRQYMSIHVCPIFTHNSTCTGENKITIQQVLCLYKYGYIYIYTHIYIYIHVSCAHTNRHYVQIVIHMYLCVHEHVHSCFWQHIIQTTNITFSSKPFYSRNHCFFLENWRSDRACHSERECGIWRIIHVHTGYYTWNMNNDEKHKEMNDKWTKHIFIFYNSVLDHTDNW